MRFPWWAVAVCGCSVASSAIPGGSWDRDAATLETPDAEADARDQHDGSQVETDAGPDAPSAGTGGTAGAAGIGGTGAGGTGGSGGAGGVTVDAGGGSGGQVETDAGPVVVPDPEGTVSIGERLWQRDAAPNYLNWLNARSYCERLTLAGGGWRLPELAELESLIDHRFDPLLDPAAFGPSQPAGPYWSATPLIEGGTANAWNVHFRTGESKSGDTNGPLRVRCVR